jgi:hypothetical protein
MSVEVRRVEDTEEWNRYVDRAPASTFFHRAGVLELQAEHSGATLHPLAGFKGEEPVGIFPLFSLKKGPVTGVFSPPPYLFVTYLGPALLNQAKLSRRKAERRHLALIEGCFEHVAERSGPLFTQVTTTVGYGDVRPFKWSGYDVIPQYTYQVDLDAGEDGPLSRFSSDARRNVTASYDEDYVIEEGAEGVTLTATTEFELDRDLVGPILDATVISRQRKRELTRQFDYLASELADTAIE